MSNGAFAFFAITLYTMSLALAVLLACMVIQGNSSAASALLPLKHTAYYSSLDDRAFCLSSFFGGVASTSEPIAR